MDSYLRNGVVCAIAAAILFAAGCAPSFETLQQDMQNPDGAVRREAVQDLVPHCAEKKEAVELLCTAARDKDELVARAAVKQLGRLFGPGGAVADRAVSKKLVTKTLLAALNDRRRLVQFAAVEEIRWLEEKAAMQPLMKLYRSLLKKNVADEMRRVAIHSVFCSGGKDSIPFLIEALRNDKPKKVREVVVQSLGTLGADAVAPLLNELESEDPAVRSWAAVGLGFIGDARAVPALLRHMADEHMKARLTAAWALGAIRDTRAVDALIRALQDENRQIRACAAKSLAEIGDARAAPPIQQAIGSEKSSWVRKHMKDALQKLSKR